MKSNILLFGAIFIFLLLLTTSSVSAIEYKSAVDANTTKLKQSLTNGGFVDIALLLTILNVIIVRVLNGLPMIIRGVISTVEIILFILYNLQIAKQEYQSGMSLPRYKAYWSYFSSLFSIISLLIVKSIPGKFSKIVVTQILFVISMLLAKYLGNILYVALDRPGG